MNSSRNLVLLLLTHAVYTADITRNTLRIVNGSDASIEDYPYQISVQIFGRHACGGSILNENFILTAAHCIYDVTAEQVTVRAGSSYRNNGGDVYRVADIQKHSLFNEETYDFDIALLRLQTTLKTGPGVRPIVVASSGTIFPNGVQAKATGWGRLSEGGSPASQLQVVSLPIISTQNCRSYYPPESITNRMICAGFDEGGKDTCEGDSGGPLVVSGIQIGITSWGGKCAEAGSPGVYTKLSEFRDYIDSLIQ